MPHLARIFSHRGKSGLRDDAYFLLMGGSWLGGGVAVGGVLFAEPLVGAALSGSASAEQVTALANIIKVGVLQVPVAIAGTLIAKMAIVSGASSRVVISALAGCVVNLGANLVLVPHWGVMGVACGALLAVVVSTVSMAAMASGRVGLAVREWAMLLASWVVWAGVCVAVNSPRPAVLIGAAVVVVGMAAAQVLMGQGTRDCAPDEAMV